MSLWEYITYVWRGIGEAMRLNPQVFEVVEAYPNSRWVILGIALVGGASMLIGQSVILFVNRVRPGRFALSLLLNGIVLTISLLMWALMIWIVGRFLFAEPVLLGQVMRMVGLGAAPYALGIFVLAPYAGTFIGRLLSVWSFLVVLRGIEYLYNLNFWSALLIVGVGWLLLLLLQFTVGRPVVALRNWLWHKVAGSRLDARVTDILLAYSADEPAAPRSGKAP